VIFSVRRGWDASPLTTVTSSNREAHDDREGNFDQDFFVIVVVFALIVFALP
jgi:hypothetical protein